MRNRFPGHCIKCLRYVPAGEGHPQKAKGCTGLKWHVKCVACVEADRAEKHAHITNLNSHLA